MSYPGASAPIHRIVIGSKGDEYTVTVYPGEEIGRCTCIAGKHGKDCRHQKAVRATLAEEFTYVGGVCVRNSE